MKERPIIFDEASVRGILAGLKTQTRRVLQDRHLPYADTSRFGDPGDRLWVRESWTEFMDGIVFRADTTTFSEEQRMAYGVRWRSPIHMSRLVSRITLEITEVRLQRVQEISEIDCEAELGLKPYSTGNAAYLRFMERWEKLNATRGYTWESNPWVWALTFKRVTE